MCHGAPLISALISYVTACFVGCGAFKNGAPSICRVDAASLFGAPNSIPASHILLLAAPFMFFSYKTINIDIAFAALLVRMNSSQSWKIADIFSPDATQTPGRIVRDDSHTRIYDVVLHLLH